MFFLRKKDILEENLSFRYDDKLFKLTFFDLFFVFVLSLIHITSHYKSQLSANCLFYKNTGPQETSSNLLL